MGEVTLHDVPEGVLREVRAVIESNNFQQIHGEIYVHKGGTLVTAEWMAPDTETDPNTEFSRQRELQYFEIEAGESDWEAVIESKLR